MNPLILVLLLNVVVVIYATYSQRTTRVKKSPDKSVFKQN